MRCFKCRNEFWIYGDIANAAYQLFVFNAYEQFQAKRYMRCVASLAQGWEIFYSTFAYSNYLYRPFFSDPSSAEDIEQFNSLNSELYSAIRKFAFADLRNVLINTVLKGVHPQTLQESQAAISRIVSERFKNNPKKADFEKLPDNEMRDILEQLQGLQIGELRNKVVHQHAYRPRRTEVEKCCEEEVRFLYHVKRSLRVGTFDEWRAGVI